MNALKGNRAMSETKSDPAVSRRRFFKTLGAGAAVAAAPVAVMPAQAVDPGAEEKKARYRESEQVKAYYRTNRY